MKGGEREKRRRECVTWEVLVMHVRGKQEVGERKEEALGVFCVEVVVARGGRVGGERTEPGREKARNVVDY